MIEIKNLSSVTGSFIIFIEPIDFVPVQPVVVVPN